MRLVWPLGTFERFELKVDQCLRKYANLFSLRYNRRILLNTKILLVNDVNVNQLFLIYSGPLSLSCFRIRMFYRIIRPKNIIFLGPFLCII